MKLRIVQNGSWYLVVIFETLLCLYFKIPRFVKECTVNDLLLDRRRTGGVEWEENLFDEIWLCVLLECNFSLCAINRDRELPRTGIKFSKWERHMNRTEYLLGPGYAGCWKGRTTVYLTKVFQFVVVSIVLSTEREKPAPMTRVHTLYSEIVADKSGESRQVTRMIPVAWKEESKRWRSW